MLAELEPEAEVVSTPVTVEGDLAGVFEREVVSQRLWDGKPLPALEAAVGLNACVDEEVPEEDGRTCGGVHAQGTKVGFFLVSIQLVHGERQQWVAQVFHVGLRGARVPQFPPAGEPHLLSAVLMGWIPSTVLCYSECLQKWFASTKKIFISCSYRSRWCGKWNCGVTIGSNVTYKKGKLAWTFNQMVIFVT